MRARCLGVLVAAIASTGCFGHDGVQAPIHEQRLASGKVVKVVSCQLAWGGEHGERQPDQDAFSLEYLSSVPRIPSQDLEHEVEEVFDLIRPISEQWGLSNASVTALRTPERTGTYDAFAFTRTAAGRWTHTVLVITRNKA